MPPSILRINPDRVGPGEPVRLTLLDQSIDFTDPQISAQLLIGLDVPRPSASSGTITHIMRNWSVIDRDELEFRVDQVGPRTRGQVPPGVYDVFARAGVQWIGVGDMQLSIQRQPTASRAATLVPPVTPVLMIQLAGLRTGLFLRSLPILLPSAIGYAINRITRGLMGFAMRNPRLLPIVPGGGPGPPAAGGPAARGGGAGGAPAAPAGYVKPFADGSEGFPAIQSLTGSASNLCFIATWGFDEDIRWSGAGQNDTGTPTAVEHLKARAVEMARLAESRVSPRTRSRVYSNIRVLLWDASLDDDFGGSGNDIGSMSLSWVDWNDVRGLTPQQIGQWLRDRDLSGESRQVLAGIHDHYRRLRRPEPEIPYPSGIMVATQNHPENPVTGSHHQKFVLCNDAAYVGGLNFHKDYWDNRDHRRLQPGRDSSKGLGSGGSGDNVPLHDSGAILSHEGSQRRLLRVFASRWDQEMGRTGPYPALVEGGSGIAPTSAGTARSTMTSSGYSGGRPGRSWVRTG